jgi:apolipoprotein N-acyltransferase
MHRHRHVRGLPFHSNLMFVASLKRLLIRDRSTPQFGRSAQIVLGVIAGALLSAGYALHPQWWAPWLAPVPLLLATSGSRRSARLAGGVAGAIAVTSLLPYYLDLIGWRITLLVVLLRVGSWIFATSLADAAARRLPLAVALLVLPGTIAAIELLTLVVSPHGAAGSLAYSQMEAIGVVQVAALGGVPAVVFLILLPGSLAGLWLNRSWRHSDRLAALALLGLLALAATLFSVLRLNAKPSGRTVPVTLIATNYFDAIPQGWEGVWAKYQPAVIASATRGGLVVLPEKLALLDSESAGRAAQDVAMTSQATGAVVIAGVEVRERGTYYNRALLAAPDGRVVWYDKQRLVPGWEDRDTPGNAPVFVDIAGTRLGIAICKDMHVPEIGRQYAGGATIMVVPAYDFGRDAWMGARMTAMRAVENGYAVARSARNGFVSAYDRTGRILVERPVTDDMTIATASLSPHEATTFYGRNGDVFGWCCVCLALLLRVWLGWGGLPYLSSSNKSLSRNQAK